jgi:signal transduction histidine kinase/ligand-binding sensor domain-containing protein/DNA-binding response OmpR family regulator
MKKTLSIVTLFCLLSPVFSQMNREGSLKVISFLFTKSHGLSSSKITCLTQDERGFFWVGTEDGLNVFDGFNFVTYKKQYGDTLSLASNQITSLFHDSKGRTWIGTMAGLEYYDPDEDGFVNGTLHLPERILKRTPCAAMDEDKEGALWFASFGIGVVRYLPDREESVLFEPSRSDSIPSLCSAYIRAIETDNEGNIWLGSQDKGISVYNPATHSFRNIHSGNSGLPDNAVNDIKLLRNGNVLIATQKGGVSIYDTSKKTLNTYPDVFNSPATRSIVCANEDKDGNILVGTKEKGILLFDAQKRELRKEPLLEEFSEIFDDGKVSCIYIGNHDYLWIGLKYKGVFTVGSELGGFYSFRKINYRTNSLNYNYVTGITTDRENHIWIATDGGGLNRFNPLTDRFTHYINKEKAPQSLSDNEVASVFCDSKNRLWAGTRSGGLCLFNRNTDTFTCFRAKADEPNQLQSDCVKSIREDKKGNLWLGTGGGGLACLDPENKTFRTYQSAEHPGLINDYITILFADSKNRLWIGTSFGLSRMNMDTKSFGSFNGESGLKSQSVYSIAESSDGTIWVGTPDGLHKYNEKENKFSRVEPSSPNETAVINGIVPDNNRLWLATNQGIVCYDIENGKTKHYTQANSGLVTDEYLPGAYYKSPEGEIFFGGAGGLDAFYPNEIQDTVTIQNVYITQLKIFNEPVLINKEVNGRVVLPRHISGMKKIVLQQADKNFTLEYVAGGSFKPYSTVYACMLEGFDTDWVKYDYTQRSVTYTNLSPGTYIFRIKASSDPNVWGDRETSLIIEIKPALWNTWWAKVLYVLAAFGFIFLIVCFVVIRIKEKGELRIGRITMQHQEELNKAKTNFFANISHEFRTLLTLIIGPLSRLVNDDAADDERRKTGHLILRNAERLQHFINQILDMNRLEDGKKSLHVQVVELVSFVSHSLSAFTELMQQKNISLTYNWKPDKIDIWYDPEMLDKCLNNLLYNAYKFTPPGGKIEVNVHQSADGKVILSVQDTGVGMNEETKEHVFDRFFQRHKYAHEGLGIGMHLTKSIVEAHRGTITVESEEGKGSCFYITILPGYQHFTKEELGEGVRGTGYGVQGETASAVAEEEAPTDTPAFQAPQAAPSPPRTPYPVPRTPSPNTTVLLIEDNADIRYYIRNELQSRYHIEEAPNGKKGLNMARQLMPDLIVTDIMMPEMNGIELCHILKESPETSHIPIIILTAQDDMAHRMEGMESGADSYITKPFNIQYLQVNIEKLIETRRKMKERFSKSLGMDAKEIALTGADERLLQKAINYIRSNIENPELSVEAMSKELGMSRVHLHRKLKGLTGQKPVDFIKTIRMKQAAYLLTMGKLTVSEVSYLVGYNTPAYFSSSFSAHFGMSPTAYMAKEKTAEANREKNF